MKIFDCVVPGVALAQGFGRIGCFLAGCCYGAENTGKFGVIFPEGAFIKNVIDMNAKGKGMFN